MHDKEVLLSVRGLRTYFPVKKGVFRKTVGHVKALDNVDLEVFRGEILGIVGESGCGKTTLGKSILNLVKPTSGEIVYSFPDGRKELTGLRGREMDEARKKLQIVFQDPYSSLNPSFTIFGSLQEPLIKFGVRSRQKRREMVADILRQVNLPPEYMTRYPNEFSGGQRQRIGIARALLVSPELIVCDEAVSALDVSIQAQVLKLLKDLREQRNLTYLFITHDLSVVEYISDRIVVMYLGRIVEIAETDTLFANPLHPYTRALLAAIPIANVNKKRKRSPLQGDVPNPIDPPPGCPFHPRCPSCVESCRTEEPQLRDFGGGHLARCHLAGGE